MLRYHHKPQIKRNVELIIQHFSEKVVSIILSRDKILLKGE